MLSNQGQQRPTSSRVIPSVHEETGKGYECAICYEEVRSPVTLRCGHMFCWRCVDTYWNGTKCRGKRLCPFCRAEINMEEDVIPVLGQGIDADPAYSKPRPRAPLSKKTGQEPIATPAQSTQQTDTAGFWKATTAVSVAGIAALGMLFAYRETRRSRQRRQD